MTQNMSFARGGTSSWADDDDIDLQPLPVAPKIASTDMPLPIEEKEESESPEQQRDEPHSNELHEKKRDERQETYGDRRGGHRDNRGGYDDHRRSREERPKNPVPDVGPWKLFVGNLPFRLTEDDLADFIGPDGIKEIRFPRDYDNRPKGFAYVEFDDKKKLIRALDLDGRDLHGRSVKTDVALSRDRERKPRNNSRFEKRNDRSSHDRSREGDETCQERQRLSLLPRTTTEKKDSDASIPSIFGEAKPRDESAYLERKKALELERKKALEQERKKALEQERKAKAKEAKVKEAKVKEAKENEAKDANKLKQSKAKTDTQAAVLTRRSSRDDGHRGGRGRGRSRGDRRPVDGGRGRNNQDVLRQKPEPRPKRTEPSKTKISAPVSVMTANVFEALNDSDSCSD